MNKQAELTILDRAIKALGSDSYLGPWLSYIRGEVEMTIRSDYFPEITLASAAAAGKKKSDEVLADERFALNNERMKLEAEKKEFARQREALEVEKGRMVNMLNSLAERVQSL
jgi:hypothetical protein